MLGVDDPIDIAVVDASVAVRWIATEPGSEAAVRLLQRPIRWIAPRLLLTEVAGALRLKVVEGIVAADRAIVILQPLLNGINRRTIQLSEDERIVASALTLSIASGHRVPDCMYVALAEIERAALITADARLGDLADRQGIPTLLMPTGR